MARRPAPTHTRLPGAHPYSPTLTTPQHTASSSQPLPALGGMRHIDWALRALDGHGLDDNTRLHTAISLFGYVRGTAADLESEEQAARDTGMSGEEWLDSQEGAMTALLAGGALPAFAAVRHRPDVDVSVQSLFEYGLGCLLDGVALLMANNQSAGIESAS
ncbi:TetR/AcrR family transcriptional regulator C-terminal domain-containing protein [Streptomyces sp. NPDC002896]|uniref:TetR/AcrR family transcriptional regulator C-terminal domain-containing protein n=1 Tax=Streptomyces sp. NPDC002896 TaxID=3154438 RepID=UPI003322A8F6